MGCSCPVLTTTIDLGLSTHGRHGEELGRACHAANAAGSTAQEYSDASLQLPASTTGSTPIWLGQQPTSSTLAYATPESRRSGSAPFRRDCCQYCRQAAGRRPTHVDNPGRSAQPTIGDGRSWTTCPLQRNRRSLPGRDPTGMLRRQGGRMSDGAWLQFNAVRCRTRRTDRARWSSLNQSEPLCPELLMRLGVTTLRSSNPRSSAADPVRLCPAGAILLFASAFP